jgi:hypothetical protein
MLSVIYAGVTYAECHSCSVIRAQCYYAESRVTLQIGQTFLKLKFSLRKLFFFLMNHARHIL